MLFIYLFALVVCVSMFVGSFVLLSVPELYDIKFIMLWFVTIMVIGGTAWASVALFNAAREELVYWL